MRLTVVGSSDAFNSAGRGHSCYLIESDDYAPVMLDFGATAIKNLKNAGHDHRQLGALLITHLHGDHIGGYPYWLLDSMYNLIRTQSIDIVGPVGVEARLAELLKTTYGDDVDEKRSFDITFTELRPGDEIEVLGHRVRAFAADHIDPPEIPLCLRVTGPDGKIVAFSGDTAFCPGLFAAASGADLLVAECTAMAPPAGRHCTWEEWQDNFDKLNCPRLLLTHLNEEVRQSAPTLRGPDNLDLSFADDGMVISV